jgi:hypothetical protein
MPTEKVGFHGSVRRWDNHKNSNSLVLVWVETIYSASGYRSRWCSIRKNQRNYTILISLGAFLVVSSCISRDTVVYMFTVTIAYLCVPYKKIWWFTETKRSLPVFVHGGRIRSQFCFIFLHIWSYYSLDGHEDNRTRYCAIWTAKIWSHTTQQSCSWVYTDNVFFALDVFHNHYFFHFHDTKLSK